MSGSSVNDEASVIAIDIGGGTTKLALISRQGEVRGWRSFPTAGESGAAFLQEVVGACRQLRAEATAQVIGVSAAVAGFVSADGALEYNPNLPCWKVYLSPLFSPTSWVFASTPMPTRTQPVAEKLAAQRVGLRELRLFLCTPIAAYCWAASCASADWSPDGSTCRRSLKDLSNWAEVANSSRALAC